MAESQDKTITTTLAFQGEDEASATVREMKEKIKKELKEISKEKIALADPDVQKLQSQLKAAQGGEGFFKSLKGGLGEESTIGNIGKLLNGAGAVAGISAVGNGLLNATNKIKELRAQSELYGDDWAQNALEVGKTVPIYGSIVAAGENINDLFTGQKARLEAIKTEAENIKTGIDLRRKAIESENEQHKETLEILRRIDQEQSLVGLKGDDLAKAQADIAASNSSADVFKQLDANIKKAEAEYAAMQAPYRANAEAAEKRLSEAQQQLETSEALAREAAARATKKDENFGQTGANTDFKSSVENAKAEVAAATAARESALREQQKVISDRDSEIKRMQKDAANVVAAQEELAARKQLDIDRERNLARREAEQKYQEEREKQAREHVNRLAAIFSDSRAALFGNNQVAADFEKFRQQYKATVAEIDARAAERGPMGIEGIFGGKLGGSVSNFLGDAAERYAAADREKAQERQRLLQEQKQNAKPFWEAAGRFVQTNVIDPFNRHFNFGSPFGTEYGRRTTGLPAFSDAGNTTGLVAAAKERQAQDPLLVEAKKQSKAAADANGLLGDLPKDLANAITDKLNKAVGFFYPGNG